MMRSPFNRWVLWVLLTVGATAVVVVASVWVVGLPDPWYWLIPLAFLALVNIVGFTADILGIRSAFGGEQPPPARPAQEAQVEGSPGADIAQQYGLADGDLIQAQGGDASKQEHHGDTVQSEGGPVFQIKDSPGASISLPGLTPPVQPVETEPTMEGEPPPEPALRLLVLLAAPLVDAAGDPAVRLDLEAEQERMAQVFSESGAHIQVRYRPATTQALGDGVRDGYEVVHFSGHGDWEQLVFEDRAGRAHPVDRELLARLLKVGDRAARLVVLDACHSASVADDLIAAGVEHVVAVERTSAITDLAAIAFARTFYHALSRGETLETGFTEGQDAVASDPELGFLADVEERKFRVLPEDGDHAVVFAPPDTGRGGYVEDVPPDAPTNLPAPLPTFVGRERSMHRVNRRLRGGRLVTLTGTGGIGKTELARETLRWHHQRGRFPDGVFLVELESAATPAAVLTEIATALGLERAQSAADVAAALGGRRLLVGLDNLDDALRDALTGTRDVLEALLEGAPALQLLVTSRQRTGLTDLEQVVQVQRLRRGVDRQLFRDLAGWAGYEWHAGDEEALPAVLDFLDRMPLAIRLAAAQLAEITLAELRDALAEKSTAVLNQPGVPDEELARRTSVDVSLALSYDRLDDTARRLCGALALIPAGADAGALDAVWGDARWRDSMRRLRRLSLVNEADGRYTMLNPVREFSVTRLPAEEADLCRERMARHYQAVAAAGNAAIGGEHTVAAVSLLAQELPDIRAGMDWAQSAGDRELAGEYAKVLTDFYDLRGLWQEGAERLRLGLAACDEVGDEAGTALLMHNLAILVQNRGEYGEARRLYEASLEIKERLGNQAGIASSLHNLGRIAQDQGDVEEARRLYEASLEIDERLGNQAGIAISLHNLGLIAQDQGDVEEARRLYEQALEIFERLRSPNAEIARRSLARLDAG